MFVRYDEILSRPLGGFSRRELKIFKKARIIVSTLGFLPLEKGNIIRSKDQYRIVWERTNEVLEIIIEETGVSLFYTDLLDESRELSLSELTPEAVCELALFILEPVSGD